MKDPMIAAAFSKPAPFSNEATLTTDPESHLHRLTFLEVDPDGTPHHVAAVLITTQVLERLHEIFGQRLAKPGILKPNYIGGRH